MLEYYLVIVELVVTLNKKDTSFSILNGRGREGRWLLRDYASFRISSKNVFELRKSSLPLL